MISEELINVNVGKLTKSLEEKYKEQHYYIKPGKRRILGLIHESRMVQRHKMQNNFVAEGNIFHLTVTRIIFKLVAFRMRSEFKSYRYETSPVIHSKYNK